MFGRVGILFINKVGYIKFINNLIAEICYRLITIVLQRLQTKYTRIKHIDILPVLAVSACV